jgi:hypothetical protein
MSFFGFGPGQQNQARTVETTAGGVPQDAIARLRRMSGVGGAPMFTSDLSVSEFVLLDELEMQPLGLVLGSSIFHVGFQIGNYFQNQELGYLSQAMYRRLHLGAECARIHGHRYRGQGPSRRYVPHGSR